MSSPVGAHAPAGDPFFRRVPRLPGSASRTARRPHRDAVLVAQPGPRPDPRTAYLAGCPVRPAARCRLAGCPAPRPRTSMSWRRCPPPGFPVGDSDHPDHRLGFPGCPARPPQRPTASPVKVHRRGSRIILHQHRFPPREPGWPSDSPRPPLRAVSAPRHRSSGSGWRCACRYVNHSATPVFPGQEGFSVHTGLSPDIVG
jgi:hypothetical protein